MSGFKADYVCYDENVSCVVTKIEEYIEALQELGQRLIDGFNGGNLYSELVLMYNMEKHRQKHHEKMFGKYPKYKNHMKLNTKPIFIRPKSKLPYIRKKF